MALGSDGGSLPEGAGPRAGPVVLDADEELEDGVIAEEEGMATFRPECAWGSGSGSRTGERMGGDVEMSVEVSAGATGIVSTTAPSSSDAEDFPAGAGGILASHSTSKVPPQL
jgi:hypothetical protein